MTPDVVFLVWVIVFVHFDTFTGTQTVTPTPYFALIRLDSSLFDALNSPDMS